MQYTDCTTAKSPDGKNTGKEWCYVDPKEGGSTKWAYCVPVLDFDKLRRISKQMLDNYIPELRKTIDLVQKEMGPAAKLIADFKKIGEL